MELLLAGGALWLLLLVLVISICRAAARADDARGRRRTAVAVAATAAAATLPAAPAQAQSCTNRDVRFEVAPAAMRDALLCEIARTRERRLRGDRRLARAAERHAADMVERGYFSHESPGGGELRDRLRRAGYARERCSWSAGEVLAWGVGRRSTARAVVRAWLDSRPHRRVLERRRYEELGVGLRAGTPRYPARGVTVVALLGDRRCSR